jgi:hypothetical protein
MTIIDPGTGTKPVVDPAPPEPTGVVIPKEDPTPPPPPAGDPKPPAAPAGKTFTTEDIEKARKEEKDKLYKSIEDMKGELSAMKAEREAREKAAKDAEKAAKDAEKAKTEEEMSAKQLLEQRAQEWEQRFAEMQANQAKAEALLEQERKFSGLMEYRSQRMQAEVDNILPQLIDMISGGSEEEIEQSIERLKAKTAQIVGDVQQAQQAQRQGMPGTKITAPPSGPMEAQPGTETLTAEDIRNMDMNEYGKKRHLLMGAAAQKRNQGLFG